MMTKVLVVLCLCLAAGFALERSDNADLRTNVATLTVERDTAHDLVTDLKGDIANLDKSVTSFTEKAGKSNERQRTAMLNLQKAIYDDPALEECSRIRVHIGAGRLPAVSDLSEGLPDDSWRVADSMRIHGSSAGF